MEGSPLNRRTVVSKPKRELFAICSYVPPWHDDNEELVRRAFKHLFVFYPTSGDHPEWGIEAKAMLDAPPLQLATKN